MTSALEMSGVVKRYRRFRALDGLDLTVPNGSVFGLVGSNGAGKTTALTSAVGLLSLHGGDVNLLGDGPFDPDLHRGRVSLLPQDAHIPDHARVEQILWFYGRLQGIDRQELRTEIERVLKRVNLWDRRRAKARTLSHGMRRRLTIAQAFLGSPELVLLDEPLNGLDPKEVVNMRNLFLECRGKQTLIISSHILSEVAAVCDHVAFIEEGKTVRQDTLSQITRDDHQILYRLVAGPLPLDAIQQALPKVEIRHSAERGTLTLFFPDEQYSAEQVNAAVLPLLLEHGVGVLEIQRGSDLEQEYLEIH